MSRLALEVADIFRALSPAYRAREVGHLSFGQLRVMSAIEACRTAALGGHVTRCEDCAHIDIAYNSCRNRHCPKCQAAAAYDWLQARRAELLPVAYYHVVFTLPAPIADIAYTNKAVIYDALFKAASETLLRIAADPKHLGAKIGVTMVLHTWGSALTHHPHVHCVVPGGGLSPDGQRWISCKPGFFLPVKVLSRLFRRLMCQRLAAHAKGALQFFAENAGLRDADAFSAFLKPLRRMEWVVYANLSATGRCPLFAISLERLRQRKIFMPGIHGVAGIRSVPSIGTPTSIRGEAALSPAPFALFVMRRLSFITSPR